MFLAKAAKFAKGGRSFIFPPLFATRKGPRALPGTMPVQAIDFPPVIAILLVFYPISQVQGFGFSPVTGFPRIFYLRERRLRRAQTSTSSVESSSRAKYRLGLSLVIPPGPAFDFFWEVPGRMDGGSWCKFNFFPRMGCGEIGFA
jgi:hypothetical protein